MSSTNTHSGAVTPSSPQVNWKILESSPRVAILARRIDALFTDVGARTPLRRWCSGAARNFAALVTTCWMPLAMSFCVVAVLTAVLAR